MNKGKLSFALILITCIVVSVSQSCTKTNAFEELTAPKTSDRDIISTYSKIGEIHNDMMDFMYNGILTKLKSQETVGTGRVDTLPPYEISLLEINELCTQYVKDSLHASGFPDYKVFYFRDTLIKNPGFSDDLLSVHYTLATGDTLSPQLTFALSS